MWKRRRRRKRKQRLLTHLWIHKYLVKIEISVVIRDHGVLHCNHFSYTSYAIWVGSWYSWLPSSTCFLDVISPNTQTLDDMDMVFVFIRDLLRAVNESTDSRIQTLTIPETNGSGFKWRTKTTNNVTDWFPCISVTA